MPISVVNIRTLFTNAAMLAWFDKAEKEGIVESDREAMKALVARLAATSVQCHMDLDVESLRRFRDLIRESAPILYPKLSEACARYAVQISITVLEQIINSCDTWRAQADMILEAFPSEIMDEFTFWQESQAK